MRGVMKINYYFNHLNRLTKTQVMSSYFIIYYSIIRCKNERINSHKNNKEGEKEREMIRCLYGSVVYSNIVSQSLRQARQ